MTDPWARPADQAPPAAPQQPAATPPPAEGPSLLAKAKKLFSDPLSIVLVVVIVLALVFAGVLGGELFARKKANSVVAGVVSCIVKDSATASFDPLPPFLWQHINKHYTNINIETAGNQIRDAKGMKVTLAIKDVQLAETDNSSGTVGSLTADIAWSTDGIRETAADMVQLPFIGSAITDVATNPSDGTIKLKSMLGSITAKPTVTDGGISLEVTDLSFIGMPFPRETIQPILNTFSKQLTDNYPMGIHADSVQVTDTGVTARYSTQNATMPKATEDPCFKL